MGKDDPVAKHLATHYEVLCIARGATAAEVRAAYRSLAKAHHPDVDAANQGGERFDLLARAYEVLGDAVKRRAYDLELEQRELSARSGSNGHGHYAWENIAAPKSAAQERRREDARAAGAHIDPADFDDLYDTYFGVH